jgi:hypothetical protein
MKLGCWVLKSGNVVEVVVTTGAGDKPALLDMRCEWARWPPSSEDVAEYLHRVQREIAERLAAHVQGRVLVVGT